MRNIWKFVSLVVFCVAGFAVSSVAPLAAPANQQKDEQASELPPSPLEAFAARSTATVVWSKLIGRLEGPVSRHRHGADCRGRDGHAGGDAWAPNRSGAYWRTPEL